MKLNYTPYKIKLNSKEKFEVLKFEGIENFNRPYEYNIQIISSKSDLKLEEFLLTNVTLQMQSAINEKDKFNINGIIKSIKTKGFFLDEYIYEIALVSSIWKLNLQQSSKVYLDISIVDIIKECMKKNGFNEKLDYDIKLSQDYGDIEFICQYNETDLNFLNRWIESYGIYYYFENSSITDKVIFTDDKTYQKNIKNSSLEHSDIDHQLNSKKDINISKFDLIHSAVFKSFEKNDYDGTIKDISKNISSKNQYEQNMQKRVYGGNPNIQKSFPSNEKFIQMEQQRIEAYKYHIQSQSTVISMHIGGTFDVKSKFTNINGKYLIKKLIHKGDQTQLLKDKNTKKEDKIYENYFEAIPYETQYRPQKTTPIPKVNGVLNATIDAKDKKTPLVDKIGRYKVLLPFDTLEKNDGKASIPVRVVQPSASNEKSGMHFKLLKDDEVVLAFKEGDIDRPIIIGAVNNASKVSSMDGWKRKDSSIELDDDIMIVKTPRKIEIIG